MSSSLTRQVSSIVGSGSLFLFLTLLIFSTGLRAQSLSSLPVCILCSDTLHVTRTDSSINLSHRFIIPGSEKVLAGSQQLEKDKDFTIQYRYGKMRFADKWRQAVPSGDSIKVLISYDALPLSLKDDYALRSIVIRKDTSGNERRTVTPVAPGSAMDEFFGNELQKNGSLFRGFTVGSNRDLSLTSGFRMQLSGRLAQDIDLNAALTDENSPIQPEGTTQTLQEVDKVYVEMKSPSFGATLGDFNFVIDEKNGGEFGRIQRKLQGGQGRALYSNLFNAGIRGEASVTGASARGKFHSNQFQGIEGNQGPYRLIGKNGERRIIVIAGTERVYLNGERMARGEVNDYSIDYASAEITFSSKRLITSASRIVADFEYSDRQYERNFLSASSQQALLNKNVRINIVFVQEADDPSSPIDVTLGDPEKEVLRRSGTDRFKASLPGGRFVGRDSLAGIGKGQYIRRDTTIGTRQYQVFVYAPADSNALYTVSFSPVESMPPDSAGYTRIGLGNFRFAGVGRGNYLPLQFLPIPQLTRTVDINGAVDVGAELSFGGEYALSQFDQNRFSTLDDQDGNGQAYRLSARYNSRSLRIGQANLGEIDLSLTRRFVAKQFVAPDRTNDVEFSRIWNLERTEFSDESITQLDLRYRPVELLNMSASYGSLERSGLSKSNRTMLEGTVSDSAWPTVKYRLENITSNDQTFGRTSSWLRQQGNAAYEFGSLEPGLRIEGEDRTSRVEGRDSLFGGSFRFLEIAPRIETKEILRMQGSAEFQVRSEDSSLTGAMRKAFTARTQLYTWQLREWNTLSSSLTLSIRKTEFARAFRQRGNVNSDVILVRSVNRFSPFQRVLEGDVFYEFSSLRSARMERVFVRVATGSGNYRYRGDLNGNGLTDETEFELTRFDGDYVVVSVPGEALYPVVDLRASTRLRLIPARLLKPSEVGLARILSAISTETYFRVDERSSDPVPENIYLLKFSHFLSNQTTIAGSNLFTQDIYLFESAPDFSVRFRFNQRNSLVQLVSSSEHGYARERSIRVRSQLVREIANLTEVVNRIDRSIATIPGGRDRDVLSTLMSSDFSYRPEREWEIGFQILAGSSVDRLAGAEVSAGINEESLRAVYAILAKGQLRVDVSREEVVLSRGYPDPTKIIPFELTNGRVVGKTYQWSASFDYRITPNVQVTASYNGRSEGGRPSVHLARGEARAFF